MDKLLERCATAGMVAPMSTIERAREYARSLYFAPSADELSDMARAIGIKTLLLCAIVYAQLAVKENEGVTE